MNVMEEIFEIRSCIEIFGVWYDNGFHCILGHIWAWHTTVMWQCWLHFG